jgi:hypothetical protein
LTKLQAEAETRTEKVINGSAAPQTFELTTPEHPLSTRDLMTAGEWLQQVGIEKDSTLFRSALEGGGVTQKDYELALIARDRLTSHAGWSRALLQGNKSAAADLWVLNIQIAAYETVKANEASR